MSLFATGDIIGYRAESGTVPSEMLRGLNLHRQAPLALIIGSAASLERDLMDKTFSFAKHLNGIAGQTGMITATAGVRTDLIDQFGRARVLGSANTTLLTFAPEMLVDLGCPFARSDIGTRIPIPEISHLIMLKTDPINEPDSDLRDLKYWQANTEFMFRTVGEMVKSNKPYAAFVIGGGEQSALETLAAISLGIPVISIYDSGRFASDLCTAYKDGIEDDMIGAVTMENILRHGNLIYAEQFNSLSLCATIREIYGL